MRNVFFLKPAVELVALQYSSLPELSEGDDDAEARHQAFRDEWSTRCSERRQVRTTRS